MKIRLTHQASQQLISAYEFLEGASAAVTQMKRIFAAIDLLETYPMAGRKGRIAGTREMVVPRTPFIIAYKIESSEVHVLAILHTSRRWPELL
jgi:plasmid stabilization system protein ParE